jgi:outer membrane protein OmpA-like peptidoglycan-associated protein
MKGCPDSDGDGIADKEDKCPKVAGVASNDGCPEIKEETKKVFEQALKGIQFEPGKDVIKKTSYGILDNVVKIMKENPSYLLEINGHTDSQGDDAKNMTLSQKRAEAVRNYLVSKGIETSRLTPKGYGETVPKATNDTPAGRAENRRVEFKVNF